MSDPVLAGPASRYRVVTKLGQGGMARVHLVLSQSAAGVNKLLVTKELHPDLTEDPDLLEMFLDEARLSVRLSHPNVVQTYEVDTSGEHPTIVMEYLDGQSLMALLHRVGRAEMPLELHLHVLLQVLSALHYAHELCDFDGTPLHVVHRDVSPQNVFCTYDGQVKLVDFGIAKAARSNRRTRTGVFKGKVTYAAPEQVTGSAIDRRGDIFSFGVMLWEALARRRLTTQEIDIVAMQQRANGEDPKIETVAPDTPEELARICNKAMAKDPEDRYSTAEDMRRELLAHLGRRSVGPHQLEELMCTVFATERTKIRKTIEARVRELTSDEPPASRAAAAIALSVVASDEVARDARPTVPTSPTSTPAPDADDSTAKVASLTPPLPRRGLGLRGRVLVGILISSAMGFTVWQVSRSPAGEASGSAPSGSPSGEPALTSTAVATVEVSISVDPPGARVLVDDVELGSNPFRGAMVRSAMTHRLRVVAAGFETEERLMVFDRDLHVQLQLRPAATATATASATGAPAAPVPAPRPVGAAGQAPVPTSAAPPTGGAPRPGDALTGKPPATQPRSIDDTL